MTLAKTDYSNPEIIVVDVNKEPIVIHSDGGEDPISPILYCSRMSILEQPV
jgi:hypothetical protein